VPHFSPGLPKVGNSYCPGRSLGSVIMERFDALTAEARVSVLVGIDQTHRTSRAVYFSGSSTSVCFFAALSAFSVNGSANVVPPYHAFH
jgi:hypothetical protein